MNPSEWSFALFNTLALIALGLVSAAGCGDGRPVRVPVAGKITVDGKPFTDGGNVVFRPQSGRPSAGELDKEGMFRLGTFEIGDGCPLGDYVVTVSSISKIGANQRRWNLPKKYHQASTSDVKQIIKGPSENLVINLSWGGQHGPLIEQVELTEDP